MKVGPAEIIHVILHGVHSIPIADLDYDVEYAVEVEEVRLSIVRRRDGVEIDGSVEYVIAQNGESFRLYHKSRNELIDLPTVKVDGAHTLIFYRQGSPSLITAIAELEEGHYEPPIRYAWPPHSNFPYVISISQKIADIGSTHIAVCVDGGRVVAARAEQAHHRLRELGVRYETQERNGYLNPVYKEYAVDGWFGRKEVKRLVCLTCIRGFRWALIFRPIYYYNARTAMYTVDVITRSGHFHDILTEGSTVAVPGYGYVDLSYVEASAV